MSNTETLPDRFKQLVDSIHTLHQDLTKQIGKAVNISLTLRNWLIGGFYIDEIPTRRSRSSSIW